MTYDQIDSDHDNVQNGTNIGIPIRNIWHMFVYALDVLRKRVKGISAIEKAPTASILFVSLLVEALERRNKIGIPHAYIEQRREIGVVRGRIDVLRSLRTHAFDRARVQCQFEAYAIDSPRNRLIKGTLSRLIAAPILRDRTEPSIDLLKRAIRCFAALDGVQVGPVTREAFRRESPGRNDADDRLVLALCELLFRGSMPTETMGSAHLLKADRELALLRIVFERFVARFLAKHLRPDGWKVERQKPVYWPVEAASAGMGAHLPRMELDLLLTSPDNNRSIVIDTKFTSVLTLGRTNKEIFKSDHLYQIYTYSKTQFTSIKERVEAILLYPAAGRDVSEYMMLPGQTIRLETIDLSKPWPEIEQSMLALMRTRIIDPTAASGASFTSS